MTRNLFQPLLLTALALALSGCTGVGYYAQSLKGHAQIMAARQPVAKLISDPATPGALRAQMLAARDIRRFAVEELALPDNASYRSYVDIGRDYVTLAVYAAPEFSLAPRVTCFPVFGCVPYQGFFSKASALRTAETFKRQGLDIHISGVTAYSTLGWTSDPLLSTMFDGDRTRLASLVFHELAHQRVYVDDDSALNEAFAVVVERTGVRAWLRAAGDRAGLRRYEASLRRHAGFLELLAQTRMELHDVYSGTRTDAQKRAAKSAAIDRLRKRYRRVRDTRWNGFRGYDAWIDAPINNAKLAATSVYNEQVPALMRLFEQCAGDYERFYTAVARIGALDRAERAKHLRGRLRGPGRATEPGTGR